MCLRCASTDRTRKRATPTSRPDAAPGNADTCTCTPQVWPGTMRAAEKDIYRSIHSVSTSLPSTASHIDKGHSPARPSCWALVAQPPNFGTARGSSPTPGVAQPRARVLGRRYGTQGRCAASGSRRSAGPSAGSSSPRCWRCAGGGFVCSPRHAAGRAPPRRGGAADPLVGAAVRAMVRPK